MFLSLLGLIKGNGVGKSKSNFCLFDIFFSIGESCQTNDEIGIDAELPHSYDILADMAFGMHSYGAYNINLSICMQLNASKFICTWVF